jgi:hypothetical protein
MVSNVPTNQSSSPASKYLKLALLCHPLPAFLNGQAGTNRSSRRPTVLYTAFNQLIRKKIS